MRKLSQTLGLGLVSSLFFIIPACGDDGGGDTSTTGHNTTPTAGTASATATAGTTAATATASASGTATASTTAGTATASAGSASGTATASTTGDATATATAGTTGGGTASSTGGDTTGTAGGSGGGDVEQEVKDLIAATCDWAGRCCMQGEFTYIFGTWTDGVQGCTDRMIEQYKANDTTDPGKDRLGEVNGLAARMLNDLAFTVNRDRSTPVAAEVTRCADYIKTLGCNELYDDTVRCEPADDAANAPCQLHKMFTGKLTQGALCNKDLGDRGVYGDIECVYGTSCSNASSGSGSNTLYQCVARGQEGESCSPEQGKDSGTCEYDLYCDSSDGKCKKRPVLGEACDYVDYEEVDGGDAKRIPCAAPYDCDPYSKTCVQACTQGFRCGGDNGCPTGKSCRPYYYQGAIHPGSFCVDLQDTGGPCNTHGDCNSGRHCSNNVCTVDKAKDDECLKDYECGPNMYCRNGMNDGDPTAVPPVAAASVGTFDPADHAGVTAFPVPAAEATCQLRIGSAAADTNKCRGDGIRACFDGALGCVKGENGDYRCQTGKIANGDPCEPSDVVNDGLFGSLMTVDWLRVSPGEQGTAWEGMAWKTMCNSGICAPDADAANPATAANVCRNGLGEGKPGCDYDLTKIAKSSCRPGLACVDNTCVAYLKPGDVCDKDYHDNNDQTGSVITDGFEKPLCDPDTKCKEFANEFRCSVVSMGISERRNNCMGANSGAGF